MKLNLGCGPRAIKGFTNIDKYHTVEELKKLSKALDPNLKGAKFLQADILDLPFKDNVADYIRNTDVIEHLKMQAVVPALREWHRVLKPGGELMVLTIEFNALAQSWIEEVANRPFDLATYHEWFECIYGTQQDDGQYHKTPFTVEFMDFVLTLAGFGRREIRVVKKGEKPPEEYFEGRAFPEGQVVRSDMLIAHAWK